MFGIWLSSHLSDSFPFWLVFTCTCAAFPAVNQHQAPFKAPSTTTKLIKLCCGPLLSLFPTFLLSTSRYSLECWRQRERWRKKGGDGEELKEEGGSILKKRGSEWKWEKMEKFGANASVGERKKVREGEAKKREREGSEREMKLLFNQWGAIRRRAEVPTVIRYTLARTACTHTETGDWVSSPAHCHKPGGDRRGRNALPELPGERDIHWAWRRERERVCERERV